MGTTSKISPSPRVLSVQSHVVSGYCGNKSATFPLQLLEFEVDIINTVQLSNHTQYPISKGQIFASKDLDELYEGLKTNKLLSLYDHILSGYVADVSYIVSMSKMIRDIKSERKQMSLDCWYTFDPVLGDDGIGFYVPGAQKVAAAYKEHLLPIADIITPNRFETSILSGIDIDTNSAESLNQSMTAIKKIHELGPSVVVLTSLALASHPDELTCIVSYSSKSCQNLNIPGRNLKDETFLIRVPKFECPFTGTGDLFAALFSGWLHKTKFDFKKSLENTANAIHEILEDTLEFYNHVNDGSALSHELRLIQNKKSILSPNQKFQAEELLSAK